ncbi:Histone mRNA stem-loop binding protein [Phytophthora cinnamomi]|uniref:Histone mRNA stem-loop binding protein n=1 Tax=Phytophthora cinnamomi TaxID=4785 RepID=UPI00355A6962|nr:Histone mRNA stem-loop binding protein [Phytophthora cinnamomi]
MHSTLAVGTQELAMMKRGADAMDAGDAGRDSQRGWKRPDHKRARHADQGRHHNGNGNGNGSSKTSATVRTLADERETDPHRLAQRQKQIDYGKNTIGYDRYCAQVPRHQRRPGRHPMTPDKAKRMGKKVFDGIVRKWRQALHKYDPPELAEALKTAEVETPEAATADSRTADADAIAEQRAAPVASAESDAQEKVPPASASTPPSRSIYENFDEDNFDEEDSDDDLL